jgi:hypothetical protein
LRSEEMGGKGGSPTSPRKYSENHGRDAHATLRATLLLVSISLPLLCGCQAAHVPDSAVAAFPGDDAAAQLDFWHDLAERKLTSNDDAFHGLLLYMDSTDPSANYDRRVATLKLRGLLPAHFSEPHDLAVERGTLAYAIVKLLPLHGGWVMHVFGPSPRYAIREVADADIFPPSSPQQTFSGSEFVGVIGKLEDYQGTASAGSP